MNIFTPLLAQYFFSGFYLCIFFFKLLFPIFSLLTLVRLQFDRHMSKPRGTGKNRGGDGENLYKRRLMNQCMMI